MDLKASQVQSVLLKEENVIFTTIQLLLLDYLELEIIILSNSMYLYYLSSYIRSFDVSSSVVIQILVLLELLLFLFMNS